MSAEAWANADPNDADLPPRFHLVAAADQDDADQDTDGLSQLSEPTDTDLADLADELPAKDSEPTVRHGRGGWTDDAEPAVTYSEWCAARGFDPATRRYAPGDS